MPTQKKIDQMAIITLQGDSAEDLIRRLTGDGFQVTIVESRGGFLLEPVTSLLIGYPSEDHPILAQHIRDICQTRKRLIPIQPDGALLPALPMMIEAETGGATFFSMKLERFIQL
jgi:uncharacterized protein YaaQ